MQTQVVEPLPPVAVDRATDDHAKAWSRGIVRGDARAFSEFYEEWFDRCVECVQLMTRRDEAFALDVVQDVMMKAADSMPALNSLDEMERWILRVAYTTSIDHVRQSVRRARREGEHGEQKVQEPVDDDLAELQGALARLTPVDRELVLMKFARGFTLKQIGETTMTTPDAAHGRIRRVVETLRRYLQGTRL